MDEISSSIKEASSSSPASPAVCMSKTVTMARLRLYCRHQVVASYATIFHGGIFNTLHITHNTSNSIGNDGEISMTGGEKIAKA